MPAAAADTAGTPSRIPPASIVAIFRPAMSGDPAPDSGPFLAGDCGM